MLKVLKNLKQSAISVIAIIILLCVQAATDLALPTYTSKIVNIGIQARWKILHLNISLKTKWIVF